MLATMIIGNLVYGISIYCYWLATNGDPSHFYPGFLLGTILFFGGIATGVVANSPGKKKLKRKSYAKSNSSYAARFEGISQPEEESTAGAFAEIVE